LPKRIARGGMTFSREANRQPKWLLPFPEAELQHFRQPSTGASSAAAIPQRRLLTEQTI
jgi:hypothetical protein